MESIVVSLSSSGIFLFILLTVSVGEKKSFPIEEATVSDLQIAFQRNQITSRKLVEYYLRQIQTHNRVLKGVIEVNPDALSQADKADQDRRAETPSSFRGLHGIPILLKDNISTNDKLNTTAGSFALLGSVVPRDAGVVSRLRKAGAIILGKASLSEWSNYRSTNAPDGWSGRGGQGKNPYTLGSPCGSSSGPAISVAANMAAVSIGSETDGSILCPSSSNSVVGIKPTVGLTSRAGVVPISPRQDTVGPICRTVSDAAYVLEAIVGLDVHDKATNEAYKYIPKGGYAQFLRTDGLKGKRIGVVGDLFNFGNDKYRKTVILRHLQTMSEKGATLVRNLEIENLNDIFGGNDEAIAFNGEFKIAIDAYLKELITSPVKSLADVIAFNKKHTKLEMKYDQALLLEAEKVKGMGEKEKMAMSNLGNLSRNGFEKLMRESNLDALVSSEISICQILGIGGYPGITVPAGYGEEGPFGIFLGGLKGSEPKLIEIAYAFEQATQARKPPSLKS